MAETPIQTRPPAAMKRFATRPTPNVRGAGTTASGAAVTAGLPSSAAGADRPENCAPLFRTAGGAGAGAASAASFRANASRSSETRRETAARRASGRIVDDSATPGAELRVARIAAAAGAVGAAGAAFAMARAAMGAGAAKR
ncbi:MAG TPA: hypothetical protein DD417_07895 [Elusimicrobia bacterium]|nr:hypothetical protein [Elusimicrobiota bacterium]